MNEEIKEMQGALRLTAFDGFSEILAKSLLMGQYPVSLIEYPFTLKLSEIGRVKDMKEPNLRGRSLLLENLNNFPWNSHTDHTQHV
jgi:membrane protein required for beta-lactamase induction